VPNFQIRLQKKGDDNLEKQGKVVVRRDVITQKTLRTKIVIMKRISLVVLTLVAPLVVTAQTIVFSDNFTGSSTIQSATPGAGTASSADYQVYAQGAAPAGYTIGSSALHFQSTVTGSTLTELAARFGGSPVTLANIGDSINLTLTFVDTANVLVTGGNANSSINIGLFNSGGVNLNQGVRLDGTQVTGGSQTYQGYVSRLMLNGNASGYNRNTQAIGSSTTAQNQDLLFNNASSSGAFNNPVGANFTGSSGGSTGFTTGMTEGATYTLSYTITLSAANAVLVNNSLFDGADTSGTQLMNYSGTSTGGGYLGSTFDTLAFGFRYANSAAEGGALDISKIVVTATIVPEPNSAALLCGGIGLLALVRRFRR
jgi:hypothetical protein